MKHSGYDVQIEGRWLERTKTGSLNCQDCYEVVVLPWDVDTDAATDAVIAHNAHHALRAELHEFERNERMGLTGKRVMP